MPRNSRKLALRTFDTFLPDPAEKGRGKVREGERKEERELRMGIIRDYLLLLAAAAACGSYVVWQ
jgi:hypothetical protein